MDEAIGGPGPGPGGPLQADYVVGLGLLVVSLLSDCCRLKCGLIHTSLWLVPGQLHL